MSTYKPLNYRIIFAFSAILLLTRVGLGSFFTSASDITVDNVARAVNDERTNRNLTSLNYNSQLAAAADFKAHDMINRKYFSHTDPEGHYIWDKIVAYGYTPYTVLGENLAVDFSSTEGLLSAWIASPTHRANILNTNFKDQGLGVAFGNTSNGEYTSSIANTFGAQPTAQQKQQVATQPKPTTTTKPAVKAEETTAPTPTTTPTPTPTPAPTPTPTTPATQTPTSSPATSVTVTIKPTVANEIKILSDKMLVSAAISGEKLNINIFVPIEGDIKSVNATVVDKTTSLALKNGGYTGVMTFDKYFQFQKYTLIITAIEKQGGEKSINYALSNLELSSGQDPHNLGNVITKIQQPDLYNVFKYIVIVFGILFMLFLVGDTLHLTGKKGPKLGSGKGSNLIVLLLMLSTLMLVSWWH